MRSMFPFSDIVHVIIGSMIGEMTHELNVSLRGGDSHSFCMACSKGNMRRDMATTATYLRSFEVGHELEDEIHPLYVYGHVFDFVLLIHTSIYYSVVEVIFSTQCLPCYFLQLQWMRLRYSPMRHSLYLDAHGITYSKHVIGVFYDDHVLLIMDEMYWAS